MSLPPRAFYSLNETSARWGCAAADLAGWAATDHLTLVTSIASVICGKQPVAGIVVVCAADMMRMFRRHGPSDEECRIYRIRPQGSVEWQYITEPTDGVVIKITDLMLLAEEVQKFEDERDLLRRPSGSAGSAPRARDAEAISSRPKARGSARSRANRSPVAISDPAPPPIEVASRWTRAGSSPTAARVSTIS